MCSRALNMSPRQDDVWGNGGIAQPYLTSAIDASELRALGPSHITPENANIEQE
jgi:hypothetical protein